MSDTSSPTSSKPPLTELNALSVGLIVGLSLALWELITLALESAGQPWGATALHVLALTSLFGLSLGGAGAFIAPPLSALSPKGWGARFGVSLPAQAQHRYAAWGLSLMLSCLPLMLVLYLVTTVAHSFNRASLAALLVSLTGLVGLSASALVAPRLALTAEALLSRLAPSGRLIGLPVSLLPWVLIALGGVGALVVIMSLPLGAYRWGALIELSVALPLYLLLASAPVFKVLRAPRLGLILAALTVIGAPLALSGWGSDHPSNQLIPARGQLSSQLLSALRLMSDADGDGVSASFGGGDCNDSDPSINPLAKEIPDNGVDENCVGGDAKTPPPPPPPPKPDPSSLSDAARLGFGLSPELAERLGGEKEGFKAGKKPNVLLILVDTMRASHLNLYGYERETMPNLKRFAEGAVTFERAFAQAPRTPFSIPSLLTGRYPSRLKWDTRKSRNYPRLEDENVTIFERFKEAGWRTEAVSAHWYFGEKKDVNLNQGLDQWDNQGELSVSESNTQSEAAGITTRLVSALERLAPQRESQPFFMFAHYFAPHGRYMRHQEDCGTLKSSWCHVEPKCKAHPTGCQFGDPKARGLSKLRNAYDSELAYVDLYLQEVFEAVERLNLSDDTLVVITSDHGEAFKEHKGYNYHGRSVYNEELHVPLIIKAPRARAQRRAEVVGLIDVLPTVGSLAGLDLSQTGAAQADGVSLSSLLVPQDGGEGEEAKSAFPERTLFLEQLPYPGHKVYMIGALNPQGLKLIRNVTDNSWELFDLAQDWAERTDLSRSPPPEQAALKSALEQYIELTP